MKVTVLAFGIAKDIFGAPVIEIDLREQVTAGILKQSLEERYPRLKQLASYLVAVNNEYAEDGSVITDRDEVAVIPPVSGG